MQFCEKPDQAQSVKSNSRKKVETWGLGIRHVELSNQNAPLPFLKKIAFMEC